MNGLLTLIHNDAKIGETRHWRGPGHFRVCSANSYHRIELDPNVTAWTIVYARSSKKRMGISCKQ
jgi:hypothetical protein